MKTKNFELTLNAYHLIDCLEGMAAIATGSIRLIIADPPYFMGLTHNGQKAEFEDLAITTPFFEKFFFECNRILHPEKGELYFFTDWRGYAFYYPIAGRNIKLRNLITWDKMSGPGNFYGFASELILFASPGTVNKSGSNVWRIPGFAAGAKKRDGQKLIGSQKPTAIIEKMVSESSEPGEQVVDPFGGSGTVGEVARKLGRDFYGFEISQTNFRKINSRAKRGHQSIIKFS